MRQKKLTRKGKMELRKSGICWKCGRKIKGKEILCPNCQKGEDEKEWES